MNAPYAVSVPDLAASLASSQRYAESLLIEITNLRDQLCCARTDALRAIQHARDLDTECARWRRLAVHDDLTGIGNRRWLEERWPNLPVVGLLLVDLDGFKGVNDTLGHAAGDALLVRVAGVLAALVGDRVCRMAGDEFALAVITGENPETMAQTVLRILGADPSDGGAGVGASVGWTDATASEPLHEVLHRADLALYHAKRKSSRWHIACWTKHMVMPAPRPQGRRSVRDAANEPLRRTGRPNQRWAL